MRGTAGTGSLIVCTNNGMVVEYVDAHWDGVDVRWVGATIIEVIEAAKTAVRRGSKLFSSPLAGVYESDPLGGGRERAVAVNPYLSLVLGPPAGSLDFESAKKLDDAAKALRRRDNLRFLRYGDEEIHYFQTKDLQTLGVTLEYACSFDF